MFRFGKKVHLTHNFLNIFQLLCGVEINVGKLLSWQTGAGGLWFIYDINQTVGHKLVKCKMRFYCRSNHCDRDSNDCDVRLRHVATALSDGDHLHHSHHPHQHLCYLLPAVISAFIFT